MPSKRPRAKLPEVLKKNQEIKAYHELGNDSVKNKQPVSQQANELGMSETILRKARQFAKGYPPARLEDLFDLLLEKKPIFGRLHVGQLVAIRDRAERNEIQEKCIAGNWSLSELKLVRKKQKPPHSWGGRLPKLTDQAVLIQLDDELTTARRFVRELKTRGGQ